jgi:hypothetical protein
MRNYCMNYLFRFGAELMTIGMSYVEVVGFRVFRNWLVKSLR